MWTRNGSARTVASGPCLFACSGLVLLIASTGRAGECVRTSPITVRDVVDAMNSLASGDIPIDAAGSTACSLDRLPASRAALLPLMSAEHRRLIEGCARGRMRMQRGTEGLDVVALIEEAADHPECAATVRSFFAGRRVDVAVGSGLSDGPYPIVFDWAVVLDPRSGTLFSFVLNCRD